MPGMPAQQPTQSPMANIVQGNVLSQFASHESPQAPPMRVEGESAQVPAGQQTGAANDLSTPQPLPPPSEMNAMTPQIDGVAHVKQV